MEMKLSKDHHVEVKLNLDKEIYDLIEKVSRKLGIEPESWINLVILSKLEKT
jgi:hypothetical protein